MSWWRTRHLVHAARPCCTEPRACQGYKGCYCPALELTSRACAVRQSYDCSLPPKMRMGLESWRCSGDVARQYTLRHGRCWQMQRCTSVQAPPPRPHPRNSSLTRSRASASRCPARAREGGSMSRQPATAAACPRASCTCACLLLCALCAELAAWAGRWPLTQTAAEVGRTFWSPDHWNRGALMAVKPAGRRQQRMLAGWRPCMCRLSQLVSVAQQLSSGMREASP